MYKNGSTPINKSLTEKRIERIGRNQYLDLTKGFALLCVIFEHIGIPISYAGIIINSFHLPVFYIISGWLFNPNSQNSASFFTYFYRKSKGLVKPYLVLSVIIILFTSVTSGYIAGLETLQKLVTQCRYTTLWFLATLFWANIIFFLIVKAFKSKKNILIASSVLSVAFILYDTFLGVALPWNFDTAMICQIFLASGYVFRSRVEFLARQRKRITVPVGISCIIISLGLTLLNYQLGFGTFEMFLSRYGCFPLTVSAAMLASFGLIIVCSKIRLKILSELGKNSLIYFGLHLSVALPIALKLFTFIDIQNEWLIFLITFVAVMAICFVMDRILALVRIKKWMSKK